MKISSMDKKRSYFEPKSSKDENKELIIDSQKLFSEIIEFFKYEKIINENRNIFYYLNRIYLYPLQHSKKFCLKMGQAISFIKHFEYYQELTKIDKSEDIKRIKETTSLNYIIYFGENFNLHFGQFINNNYKLLSNNNGNDKDYLNFSNIDFIKKDEVYEKYYKLTLDEAEIFYELFITQIIISENRKELASCAIGLFISIYIINLLSELSSKKQNNNEILEIINRNNDKLYKLFEITNGFYGKYDFLITLLFEIVSSYQFAQKYTNLLIEKLEKEKILPSIIIILMQNHNISLNFREIKKYIEKNDLVNKNNNIFKQGKTDYQKDEEEKKIKMNNVLEQLKNKMNKGKIKLNQLNNESNNKESIKEILIYNIERNKHEHEYNIIDGINNDYTCVKTCKEHILSFTIQKTKDDIKEKINILNPKYIISKILKKILGKNSLFIYPYEDVNQDIYQIALLDELYFKIGFFKYQKKEADIKEQKYQ